VERDGAGGRADQRLQVHERAGDLGRHAGLRPGEQRERERGAGERERDERDHRRGGRGRGRRALDYDREREYGHAARRELNGGDPCGVAAVQEPRLGDDEAGRAGHGREHQQVAGE
jgi:hypothetical protein